LFALGCRFEAVSSGEFDPLLDTRFSGCPLFFGDLRLGLEVDLGGGHQLVAKFFIAGGFGLLLVS